MDYEKIYDEMIEKYNIMKPNCYGMYLYFLNMIVTKGNECEDKHKFIITLLTYQIRYIEFYAKDKDSLMYMLKKIKYVEKTKSIKKILPLDKWRLLVEGLIKIVD